MKAIRNEEFYFLTSIVTIGMTVFLVQYWIIIEREIKLSYTSLTSIYLNVQLTSFAYVASYPNDIDLKSHYQNLWAMNSTDWVLSYSMQPDNHFLLA